MKKINKCLKTIAVALVAISCVTTLTGCNDTTQPPVDAEPSEKDVVLRFVAMSDVHIGSMGDSSCERFGEAMKAAYNYAKSQSYNELDALLIAGDMTNYGKDYELQAFKSVLEKNVKKETETLLIMGNHEFFPDSAKEKEESVIERWEKALNRDKNTHNVINGYQFINLSLSGYSDTTYKPSLEWFEKELAAAAADDPNKPIFVQHHYPVKNTVYIGAE